jgi:NDP-sugar pyrophosphorylase family protein
MPLHSKSQKNLNARVIILAGSRDFGRCPVASRLPTALWPVAGKPVLQRLLLHLSSQGIKQVAISSNGDTTLLQDSLEATDFIHLRFIHEKLPAGTAGCIRDAFDSDNNTLLIVFQAQTMLPPDINMLINAHKKIRADLTVMLNPPYTNHMTGSNLPGIYICQPTVLGHIPKQGYYDIKEGLIPAMLRAGATVHAAVLAKPAANFTNRQDYLTAMAAYLDSGGNRTSDLPGNRFGGAKNIYVADSAKINPRARIYGPAIVMDNTDISKSAVIFGPAIIGSNRNSKKHPYRKLCNLGWCKNRPKLSLPKLHR